MTYKLKDEELRKKLDELTDGGLTYALKNNNVLDISYHPKVLIEIPMKDGVNLQLAGVREEIAESDWRTENHTRRFDRDVWNVYPEVEPPENVPMRVEIYYDIYCRWRGYAVFKDGYWRMDWKLRCGEVLRYRPWKDRYER